MFRCRRCILVASMHVSRNVSKCNFIIGRAMIALVHTCYHLVTLYHRVQNVVKNTFCMTFPDTRSYKSFVKETLL